MPDVPKLRKDADGTWRGWRLIGALMIPTGVAFCIAFVVFEVTIFLMHRFVVIRSILQN